MGEPGLAGQIEIAVPCREELGRGLGLPDSQRVLDLVDGAIVAEQTDRYLESVVFALRDRPRLGHALLLAGTPGSRRSSCCRRSDLRGSVTASSTWTVAGAAAAVDDDGSEGHFFIAERGVVFCTSFQEKQAVEHPPDQAADPLDDGPIAEETGVGDREAEDQPAGRLGGNEQRGGGGLRLRRARRDSGSTTRIGRAGRGPGRCLPDGRLGRRLPTAAAS